VFELVAKAHERAHAAAMKVHELRWALLGDFADDSAWISGGKNAIRDTSRHYAACANDRS
jgi:hypothetical protein